MKFLNARILAIATIAGVLAAIPCPAQSAQAGSAPAKPPVTENPEPSGKVIFSRSVDQDGRNSTPSKDAIDSERKAANNLVAKPTLEDADRRAITFTGLNLDVRLYTSAHQIAVRGVLTVRNDGKTPLTHIPLQISSSLNWEQVRIAGKEVSFPVATLNSDADHTGQLHEAAVPLAEPLAPAASLQLDVTYSGAIAPSAQRLLTVGTPENLAIHSDWDQITVPFTGLRGFGNVVWYPVSSVPAILGDGARLFDEIGRQKLRLVGTDFRMHLTVEFPHGQAPTIALINGHPAELKITDPGSLGPEVAGVATAETDNATLGFQAPSLFLAIRKAHPGTNLSAWTLAENEVAVQSWTTAATAVAPFLEDWLGPQPRSQLTLLDLPDPQDAPYETGDMLAASLHEAPANQLEGVLVHALAQTFAQAPTKPPPAWLSEGLATFMESMWIEKQQGRDRALGTLEAGRSALALQEPASPGESAGQPLKAAISPVYYRTKASYVLWMLRDMVGDAALSSAFKAYDAVPDSGKRNQVQSFESVLRQTGGTHDLSWFFEDWVDTDKGLPDLSISSVFPNAAQQGTYLVAVTVANSGYAAAEVPITVRTAKASVTARVIVPARGNLVQRLLVMGKPTEVQVNDGTVPETQASLHVTHLDEPPADASSSSSNPPAQ
jgi:hypothetical protein